MATMDQAHTVTAIRCAYCNRPDRHLDDHNTCWECFNDMTSHAGGLLLCLEEAVARYREAMGDGWAPAAGARLSDEALKEALGMILTNASGPLEGTPYRREAAEKPRQGGCWLEPESSLWSPFLEDGPGDDLAACGLACIECGSTDGAMVPVGHGRYGQLFKHTQCPEVQDAA